MPFAKRSIPAGATVDFDAYLTGFETDWRDACPSSDL